METKVFQELSWLRQSWIKKRKLQENLSLLDLHNNGLWDIK